MIMVFTQQATKPLTIPQLLNNSLKLFTKKLPRLFPTLLLYFLFSFLLLFYSSFLQPLITSITSKSVKISSLDPGSPEYLALLSSLIHDIKKLAFLESIYILSAFTLTSLVSIFAIRALFSKATSSFKGPMMTQLYIKLFSLGLYFMALSLGLVLTFTVASRGSMMLKMAVVILGMTILLLGLTSWFAMVWSVGVVVSMVEEGCYGIRAIMEAKKIVRGRRWQGAGLVLVEAILPVMLGVWGYIVMRHDGSSSPSLVVQGVLEAVGVVMMVFGWAVTVVFYEDCMRSKGMGEVEGGFMYSASLPMIEHA